jgi:glucose-6-phosphate isomerase
MDLGLGPITLRLSGSEKQARRLSDMRGFFADKGSVDAMLKRSDPVVYEVYSCENGGVGDLSYAVTVIKPGDVGGEFFMTKGHFHKKDVGEVYVGLEGEGVLLLQDKQGKTIKKQFGRGEVSYVPKGFAHRAVNTGKKELKFLAIYPSDSGHDYGIIERNGFKEIIRRN